MSFYDRSIQGNEYQSISSILLPQKSSSLTFERYSELADQLGSTISGSITVRNKDYEQKASKSSSLSSSPSSNNTPEADPSSRDFTESIQLFNAAAPLVACIVVRPRSTDDVVKTIKFCQAHNLSPSVKSGGFATAGWAIQGDVMLDMRLMDSVEMMLPQTFKLRRSNKAYFPNNVQAEADKLCGMTEGVTLCKENNGDKLFARAEGASKVDRIAHENEMAAGDASLTREEAKKRGNVGSPEAEAGEAERNSKLPRTSSGESGVDADTEGSSGSNPEIQSDSGNDESPERSDSSGDQHMVDRAASPTEASDMITNVRDRKMDWSDQSMDRVANSSHSESTGSISRSGTSNDNTSVPASADADSEDAEKVAEQSSTMSSLHWDPTSTFEHERWQRHHCPPGSSVDRVQLPSTGGFIWTADDSNSGNQTNKGTTRFLNAEGLVQMDGSNLADSRGINSNVTSKGFFHDENHSPIEGLSKGENLNDRSSSEGSGSLKPGIHSDKYQLVELGPGVGIRGIDTFTDRAGKMGDHKGKGDKGKARQEAECVRVNESGIDIMANGVPYHVPLSAYPVGSTAMTTGGFGYLSRAYGLSLDNLVEVELVLADGRVMILNDSSKQASQEEAELWWAVRGAAPCFGVVTRMVAKAFPVPRVYSGNLIYPFNPATAPSLLRHWRDCLKGTGDSIPRELYSNLILTAGPPTGTMSKRDNVIVIQICFLGTSAPGEVGDNFVQAISSWTGERVLLKDMAEKSFLNQQDGVAQVLKSGSGRRWMVRGDLLSTLTDEAIYKTVDHFHKMGSNRAVWFFELIGGAIGDTKDTCVGSEQRSAKFTVAALQQWTEKVEDRKCVTGVDTWVNEVLKSVSVGGPFACFLERQEPKDRCQGSFGQENFSKLIELKRRVDPAGMFKHTFASGLTEYM